MLFYRFLYRLFCAWIGSGIGAGVSGSGGSALEFAGRESICGGVVDSAITRGGAIGSATGGGVAGRLGASNSRLFWHWTSRCGNR